jgi:hypothetical protein
VPLRALARDHHAPIFCRIAVEDELQYLTGVQLKHFSVAAKQEAERS